MMPEAIAELERLEAEALAGKWGVTVATDGTVDIWAPGPTGGVLVAADVHSESADLVVALRNAAPDLLAAAKRVAELEQVIEQQAAVAAEYDAARRELWQQAEAARGDVERLRGALADGASIAENIEAKEREGITKHFGHTLAQLYDWRDEDAKEALAATEPNRSET